MNFKEIELVSKEPKESGFSEEFYQTFKNNISADSWEAEWIESQIKRWEVLGSNLASDTSQLSDPGQVT